MSNVLDSEPTSVNSRAYPNRMTRPRLRLTLPPLSPSEALALFYLCSKIDDLLWLHYGQKMVELLHSDPPAPGTWWSTRRDQSP